VDLSGSGKGTVAGYYDGIIEPSVFIKCRYCLARLNPLVFQGFCSMELVSGLTF
jgi:hypothetical protein